MDVNERLAIVEEKMKKLDEIDGKLDMLLIERAKERGFIAGGIFVASAVAGLVVFGLQLLLKKFGL